MFLELVRGVALLLALSMLQSFVVRHWRRGETLGKVISGVLFGGICVLGMAMPLQLSTGLIFDARSVFLAMAALFGGPVVGIISGMIAGAHRLWIGGAGAWVGLGVVGSSVALGLVYWHCRKRGWLKVGIPQFIVFGVIVHAVAILWFFLLPGDMAEQVMGNIALPFVITFTIATAVLGSLLQDLEARVLVEEALRKSERRARAIFDQSFEFMGLMSTDGILLDANRTSLEFGNVHPSDVLGKPFWDGPWWLHSKEAQEQLQDAIKRAASGQFVRFEIEHRGANNNAVTIDFSLKPVFDENGDVELLIPEGRDISTRKKLEQQVRRSQKMEAIGQLTGGIAHDFNNILGIVMGNLELLKENLTGDEVAVRRLDAALRGTQRGADITKKLLAFSRTHATGQQLISPNLFIQEVDELLRKSLTVSIHLEFDLANDLWSVKVDPGDFQDALVNLAFNARDAMVNGGTLLIETANKVIDEEYVLSNPQAHVGEYVMVSVSDTGHGMSREVIDRAMEPFFSTKSHGKGTGLGLSMVYGFVQRSGGHLKIYSEVGEGTTFNIFLPRAHETPSLSKAPHPSDIPRGSETILVVDDEEALAEVAVSQLKGLGYRTHMASSGRQALEALKGNQDIALLFSDVIMPGGMDGYDLAFQALEIRPKLKVLLTSGFTQKREELTNGHKAAYTELTSTLLSKPYSKSELAIAVRSCLDKEP